MKDEIMALAEGWLLTTEPKEYDEARAALESAVEKLVAENEAVRKANLDCVDHYNELRAELDAAKADAQRLLRLALKELETVNSVSDMAGEFDFIIQKIKEATK